MSDARSWPNRTSKRFRDLLVSLPDDVQQARKAFRLYETNPSHPSLHFERLHTTGPYYFVRVSEKYRVLGKRMSDHMLWFWIGPHETYERLISQL